MDIVGQVPLSVLRQQFVLFSTMEASCPKECGSTCYLCGGTGFWYPPLALRLCSRISPGPSGTVPWHRYRGVAVTLLLMLLLLPQHSLWAAPSETRVPKGPVVDYDAPPETCLCVAPFLRFGAEAKVEGIGAINLDLDAATPDDRALVTPEVALAVLFEPSPSFTAFLNVEVVQDITLIGPDESPQRVQVVLKEAFVALDGRAARAASTCGWGGRSSTTRASGSSMRSSMQCAWGIAGRPSPWKAL